MTRATLGRLLVLGAIWGSSFLFIKLALTGLSPAQIVLGRLAAGAAVLLAIAALRRVPLPRAPRLLGHLAVMALLANVIPFFLFGWAEQRISSGMAGVLNGSVPLFTLAFAVAALAEERLTVARALGLLLGFFGVVIVVAPWHGDHGGALSGQLACLAAAALYGVGFVYTRRFIATAAVPVLSLSAAQITLATAELALVAPAVAATPVHLDVVVAASILALGALGTGLAYVLYYRLITDAGATTASMVTYLVPIFAVLLGALVLAEPVGWNLFAGALVVIVGVALAEGRLDRFSPFPPARPTIDAPPVVGASDVTP